MDRLVATIRRAGLQVLEGGRDAASRRYIRIVADPRHANVTLLQFEEIDERRFADEMIATAAIMGQP
jgi:hypothetical protein